MSIVITESEIIEALVAASRGNAPVDAKTCGELAAEAGVSERKTRDALKRLNAQGRLSVHVVSRPALDGRLARVPAYTIAPVPKKKGR